MGILFKPLMVEAIKPVWVIGFDPAGVTWL